MATENKSSIASLEQAKKLRLMEENKRLYGTFIRERRKSMGMKQEDLAKLVGVKTISVTQWEAGRTRPDVGNIIPLCTALKISPNDFFFGRISKSLLKPDEESLLINFRILPEHDKELLVAFCRDDEALPRFLREAHAQHELCCRWFFHSDGRR